MIPPYKDDEEVTRAARATPLRVVSDPPPDDADYRHGQLMAAVARCNAQLADLQTLPREVAALRAEITQDRQALVTGASKHASHATSNRMAALLGALFTLYEFASPYLHELARWVVHK